MSVVKIFENREDIFMEVNLVRLRDAWLRAVDFDYPELAEKLIKLSRKFEGALTHVDINNATKSHSMYLVRPLIEISKIVMDKHKSIHSKNMAPQVKVVLPLSASNPINKAVEDLYKKRIDFTVAFEAVKDIYKTDLQAWGPIRKFKKFDDRMDNFPFVTVELNNE